MQIIGRSVACPAIWRAAAAGLPPFFSLTHRVHRFHDRFPADRGTSHAPTAGFASDTDAGPDMNLWERACSRMQWVSRHGCQRPTPVAGKLAFRRNRSIRPVPSRLIQHPLAEYFGLSQSFLQHNRIAFRVALKRGDQPTGVGDHPDLATL